ncbi:MAG: HAMP domain-containing sensor histidine kinase [Planctomycetota bacterium]
MRLAAKLILLYLFGLSLIVGVFTYLTVRNERRLSAAEHGRRAAELVASMRPSIQEAIRSGSDDSLDQMLVDRAASMQSVQMRWIRPDSLRFTQRSIITTFRPSADGTRMVTTIPMRTSGSSVGIIEVSSDDSDAQNRLYRSLFQSAVALVSVTGLSAVVIFVGGIFMVGRPLDQLIGKVSRVGEGDFSQPVKIESRDELGKLAVAINQMCQSLSLQRDRIDSETSKRLETVNQLRHADRLGSIGRMAAGVAHEVGTPLAVVSGRAELIGSGQLDEVGIKESAAIIKSETERITGIVRQLLGFARSGPSEREPVALRSLFDDTIELLNTYLDKRAVRVETTLHPGLPELFLNRHQWKQVLTNLISNAVDASATRVYLRAAYIPDRQHVEVEVADNGRGMPAEISEHIFEPFFTTKDVGAGTGLGLSIAYGIVRDHAGTITCESQPARGSRFHLTIPASPDGIPPTTPPKSLLDEAASYEPSNSYESSASFESSASHQSSGAGG